VTLATLADKILGPVFGYTRNFHGFLFMDKLDGATFGPEGSRAIDMCHVSI
jgi:hypothetical protein